MAIKIFSVLMGLFSLTLVFLSVQDFYFLDIKPYGIDFKNVEANTLSVYELNSTQVKANYNASQWTRYQNKDIFSAVRVFGFDYNISANELTLAGAIIELSGKVHYEDINQTRIDAQRLTYDKKKENLSTRTDFTAYRGNNILKGNALSYDLPSKELSIRGVKAWLD